jgi:hypothetical protein
MAGLPHFKNSTAGPGKYEPLYLNQFEVIITPPPAVAGKIGFGNNLMLEHVLKVTSLPELAGSGSAVITQNYKFAQRTYAPAKPAQTYHQFNIDFEVNLNNNNDMYIYNALRAWADLIYDPLTGRQGLKVDYADASIQVTQFNRAGVIYRDFMFSPVFIGPNKLTETALDYAGDGIYKLTAQFTADMYTESRIGQ